MIPAYKMYDESDIELLDIMRLATPAGAYGGMRAVYP